MSIFSSFLLKVTMILKRTNGVCKCQRQNGWRMRNYCICGVELLWSKVFQIVILYSYIHPTPLILDSSLEDPNQQGLLASLTAKIINNLQITVKNIHVRYEDQLSVPGV